MLMPHSDGYIEAKPLLVMFHDPPETIGEQNAHTGAFEPHNIVVTDVSEQYVKWAVDEKFSVIDVNMPKFVTQEEVCNRFPRKTTAANTSRTMKISRTSTH